MVKHTLDSKKMTAILNNVIDDLANPENEFSASDKASIIGKLKLNDHMDCGGASLIRGRTPAEKARSITRLVIGGKLNRKVARELLDIINIQVGVDRNAELLAENESLKVQLFMAHERVRELTEGGNSIGGGRRS